MIRIQKYTDANKEQWDEYVEKSICSSPYHLIEWKDVIEKSYGHHPYYIFAVKNERVVGILPLFHINSTFFGSYIASIPFVTYGGPIVDNEQIKLILLAESQKIAKRAKASYIEFHTAEKMNKNLETNENKVTMVLSLENKDEQNQWGDLTARLRNKIRKAKKTGMYSKIGGANLLEDFYKIFAIRMHGLGSPVHSRDFFHNIIMALGERVKIFIIYLDELPIATAMTIEYKNRIENPWTSSIIQYSKYYPNCFLFWEIIKYAIKNKCKFFDFGRSSKNSGTYYFKKLWNTSEKQLFWQYDFLGNTKKGGFSKNSLKAKLAIWCWKKLPLFLANKIGPNIRKFIPE